MHFTQHVRYCCVIVLSLLLKGAFHGWKVIILTKKVDSFVRLLEAGGAHIIASKPAVSDEQLSGCTHALMDPKIVDQHLTPAQLRILQHTGTRQLQHTLVYIYVYGASQGVCLFMFACVFVWLLVTKLMFAGVCVWLLDAKLMLCCGCVCLVAGREVHVAGVFVWLLDAKCIKPEFVSEFLFEEQPTIENYIVPQMLNLSASSPASSSSAR